MKKMELNAGQLAAQKMCEEENAGKVYEVNGVQLAKIDLSIEQLLFAMSKMTQEERKKCFRDMDQIIAPFAHGVTVEADDHTGAEFPIGRCAMSQVVAEAASKRREEHPEAYSPSAMLFRAFLYLLITRMSLLDFGDLCEEDTAANADAIKNGERILAVYNFDSIKEICAGNDIDDIPPGKIYIITEADRSVTTILTPDEY